MCEFKVMLSGKKVFEDAIYVKESDGRLLFRNVLGQTKEFKKSRIVEVDVEKEELTIAQAQA